VTADAPRAVHAFVSGLVLSDVPPEVRHIAARCVLDLLGVAASGRATVLSSIAHHHAVRHLAAGEGSPSARLLFDGRRASLVGATFAGGSTIDSFDAHDGHVLTKGHAGVALFPALLALADAHEGDLPGAEFLTTLVVGYEVALRAGIALHATAADYHTSGAWNALGVAAMAARQWDFDETVFHHALGIAEYHAPRSPMMRCIDHPTMLKDGSGWGASCGMSAACLAAEGFTGSPAMLLEAAEVGHLWGDLGDSWRIAEMYFKPYPVCRWAQPAVEAALAVRPLLDVARIHRIEVETFEAATRLSHPEPATTEMAQYSLPFPVAAAMVKGVLRPEDLSGPALRDAAILDLARRVELVVASDLDAEFPAARRARVRVELADGRILESPTLPARGDAEAPLSDREVREKFHEAAEPLLGSLASDVERLVGALADGGTTDPLLDLVLSSPPSPADAPRYGRSTTVSRSRGPDPEPGRS
jgi:2-methylcitrate dehydratase PrpD